jgi:hypothetical protein
MPELSDVLLDVWSQVLVHDSKVVKLGSETFPVIRSKKKRFRQVYFLFGEMSITGLEQNPETKSNWAKIAREGIKSHAVCSRRKVHGGGCGGESDLVREPYWAIRSEEELTPSYSAFAKLCAFFAEIDIIVFLSCLPLSCSTK